MTIKREKNGGYKKGQSGNPNGRPKDQISLSRLFNEYLQKKDPKTKKERYKMFVEKAFELAMEGDTTIFKYCWDRQDGKIPDKLNVSGEDGGSIIHEIVIKRHAEKTA